MNASPWFASLMLAFVTMPAAAREIDVLQPGDEALSCKALSAQMNDLMKQQAKERRKAQGGGGMFSALGRLASPMLDTVVSQTGGATMAAADGARQVLNGAEAAEQNAQRTARPAGPSLADQRLARLTGFHTAKRC